MMNTTKNTKNTSGPSYINKSTDHLSSTVIHRLRHISNATFPTGYCPENFKHTRLTLMSKPGKCADEMENCRPISLLDDPNQLLERVIAQRFIPHLENDRVHNTIPYRGSESTIVLTY